MIEITTPSRLHFGLIHVPQANDPATQRRFGGCGLMIQDPSILLQVETARQWEVTGFHADRVRKLAEALSPDQPLSIAVVNAPGEHQGFGVGTQLSLAVAEAVHLARGWPVPTNLAAVAGRGERSGIGVNGYHSGGFIVDGGKLSSTSAILGVEDFPDWPIVLVTPPCHSYWAGADERAAFASLQTPSVTAELCERLFFGLWPALKERDFVGFSEHLYHFNRLAATPFLAAQGGVYSSQDVAAVVDFLRSQGVIGCGQSSWGPTVFAVLESKDEMLISQIKNRYPTAEIRVTTACHRGRTLHTTNHGDQQHICD
ncbi:MAG: beta-ribofuranosylaminobenzene 5'-phosphate synthase family protein [Fimbriiglobus sp.]